ncbi:Lrp/AsnC family transcriptional regulator [Nanoarchaeota archaeon]
MVKLDLEERDFKILSRLRRDSRENLTKMSRLTKIPVSTLHDRIKKYQGELITKHTVILDFKKMGYDLKVTVLLKASPERKQALEKYLKGSERVNSLFRINNGYDFMAEVLFQDMKEFREFTDTMSGFGVATLQEFFVLEDLKREGFMTSDILLGAK